MKKYITHEAYVKASIRLEELINLVDDTTQRQILWPWSL
jgi:hypothetical protein